MMDDYIIPAFSLLLLVILGLALDIAGCNLFDWLERRGKKR